MEHSAFWREKEDGTFEDCPGVLEIRHCSNDEDWPFEVTGTNQAGEPIGLSLNMVDSIRLYHKLFLQLGSMFT